MAIARRPKLGATLVGLALILAVGWLTRPAFVGTASYLDTPLPTSLSMFPVKTQCATWWLDSAVDRSTGATLPIANSTVRIARNHVLDLSGWAYLDYPPREGRALLAAWGDHDTLLALFPLKRVDVPARRHLADTLRSGFFASIGTGGRPPGKHDLSFLIFDAQRRSMCSIPGVLTVVLS